MAVGIEPKIEKATRLTPRELVVLRWVALGLSDGEIARDLCLSVRTVHFHMANLRAKMGARNRVQVINQARRLGLLPFEPR